MLGLEAFEFGLDLLDALFALLEALIDEAGDGLVELCEGGFAFGLGRGLLNGFDFGGEAFAGMAGTAAFGHFVAEALELAAHFFAEGGGIAFAESGEAGVLVGVGGFDVLQPAVDHVLGAFAGGGAFTRGRLGSQRREGGEGHEGGEGEGAARRVH